MKELAADIRKIRNNTAQLESETIPTRNLVLPAIAAVNADLKDSKTPFAVTFLKGFNTRTAPLITSDLVACTLLDPRFKAVDSKTGVGSVPGMTKALVNDAKELIIQTACKMYNRSGVIEAARAAGVAAEAEVKEAAEGDNGSASGDHYSAKASVAEAQEESPFARFMNTSDEPDSAAPVSPAEGQARIQLTAYLAQKFAAPKDKNWEPLSKFWQPHRHMYPMLVLAVRALLAMPGSSASDERLFSYTGGFTSGDQAKTSESTIECMALLGKNKDVLKDVLKLGKWSTTSSSDFKDDPLNLEPEAQRKHGMLFEYDQNIEIDFKQQNRQRQAALDDRTKPAAAPALPARDTDAKAAPEAAAEAGDEPEVMDGLKAKPFSAKAKASSSGQQRSIVGFLKKEDAGDTAMEEEGKPDEPDKSSQGKGKGKKGK